MSAQADPMNVVIERPASDYSLPAGAGVVLAVTAGAVIWGSIFWMMF